MAISEQASNTGGTNEVRDALSTVYESQNNLKFKGNLLNQTRQLIQKDQTTQTNSKSGEEATKRYPVGKRT